MSGIEIAGLAFGILPLLVEIVKSYSTILRKARTFRHYGKTVKSISAQLDTQHGIFMNEVRLLLRSVEGEEAIEAMLENEDDRRWASRELGDKLHLVLRENFTVCRGIIEDIKDSIEELRENLKRFDIFWERKPKGESIKSVIKRLKGAVQITLDETRHKVCLTSLRNRNGDLGMLRSQICAFQECTASRQQTVLPASYNAIQTAAKKLHEAICEAWCCDDAAHRGHYAKLCLDAHLQAEVRLDLAISCHEPEASSADSSTYPPPVWLHVQSMSTSSLSSNVAIQPKPSADLQSLLSLEILAPCAVNTLKKKASSELKRSSTSCKKVKQIRAINVPPIDYIVPTSMSSTIPMKIIEVNFSQTKNMCHYIRSHHEAMRAAANTKRCIGFLDSPQMYRHLFYVQEDDQRINRHASKLYSIFDVMRYDAEEALSVEDQLRLAHKTSRAILQYNNTPWLNSRWRLQDIKYFGPNDCLDDDALKTLHVSSQLSSPTQKPGATCHMEDVQQKIQNAVSDEIRYGINNMTLFFLGVALLEIAHWKPIEEQMTARDLNDEVYAARRIVSQPTQLGPIYQKIARKCLQCNFGAEPDLSKKKLQTAVYNDVICELESMIEKLEI
ncbi:uncharacterized protein EKO05_0002009 [Ascochyta rabiei]|uniref:uncharacterized protein n=1 Tax=Didymella rabiei TaxID=5454 RepID=UPI0018FFE55A|nr:uncharacterized protein EKO05_0002009 [Ascochyta rabiei]UPX11403.1 hypothetical protein EKO05_0002009 [Ascochyta rabiei]